MRSGGGGPKGAGFERDVCKALSLWLTQGKRDDLFWRTAMSGGRATLRHRKGKTNLSQVGDITAIDSEGEILTNKVVIECKHRNDLDFMSSILKNRGLLFRFWTKLVRQAAKVKKQPMIVARQNFQPTMLIISAEGADLLDIDYDRVATLDDWRGSPRIYLFDQVTISRREFK